MTEQIPPLKDVSRSASGGVENNRPERIVGVMIPGEPARSQGGILGQQA